MSDLSRPQGVPEQTAGTTPGTQPLTPEGTPVAPGSTRPLPGTPAEGGPATVTDRVIDTGTDRGAVKGKDAPAATPPDRLRTPTGTRASYTWLALTAAAIALVLLIIFILQNTQTVTVTFLWMSGSLPLAVALLIAGVATLILTLAVGAARILQLRRFSRKAARRSNKATAAGATK